LTYILQHGTIYALIFILLAMKEKSTRGGYPSEPGAVGARCRNLRKGALEPDTQRGYDAYHTNQGGTAGIVSLVPVEQTGAGVFYLPETGGSEIQQSTERDAL
jgi:hypothetical protein